MGYRQDMFYGIKDFVEINVLVKKLKLINYSQFIKDKKETFENWNKSESFDGTCEEFFDMEDMSDEEFCIFLFREGYFEKETQELLIDFLKEKNISTVFLDYSYNSKISLGVVVDDYDTFKEKEHVDNFCEKYNLGKATYFIGYNLTW